MLPLDDDRWKTYSGGYRTPYDASDCLERLINQGISDEIWEELWNELHHQGDVDQASYASVPWLVESVRRSNKLDWNPLALICVIELERDSHENPPIDKDLALDYGNALRKLPEILINHPDKEWDENVNRTALTCISLARGQKWFARACFELDRDTADRWFSEEFGWELPD